MGKTLIYKNLASYYDLIYSWKDYKKEAGKITRLIFGYKKSDGNDLLEVACGTGGHLLYFKEKFSCYGVDISQEALNVAKEKMPGVRFKKANMVNFLGGNEVDELLPFEKIKRNVLVRAEAETNLSYGLKPEERSVEQLINYGILNLNKPSGPT